MAHTMLWTVTYLEPDEKNGKPNKYEWTPTGELHGLPYQIAYEAPHQFMGCTMIDSWVRTHYRMKFSTTGWADNEFVQLTVTYDALFERYEIKQEFRYDPPDDWVINIQLNPNDKNWVKFDIASLSENNNFRLSDWDEMVPFTEKKTGYGDQGTFYWFFRLSTPFIPAVPRKPFELVNFNLSSPYRF